MAQFTRAKYETNSGAIYRCRVATTTVITANPQPTGAYTDSRVFVYVGESNRKAGLSARGVRLKRKIGTLAGRDVFVYTFRPIFTMATFASLQIGGKMTFDSNEWDIDGFKSEG